MPRRIQFVVLGVLLAVLALVLRLSWKKTPEAPVVSSANEKFQPLPVEKLTPRNDLLEAIRKLDAKLGNRNIFTASVPPPPQKASPKMIGPVPPPPLPPVDVPAKFFGYASDPQGGHRRAFFIYGEDVLIVAEGETLMNRFRLLRIGNKTAEVEEIASGRRVTLVLEEGGPAA
jgi:hypothetical protein